MRRKPIPRPASAARALCPLAPATESPRPAAATASVATFGMRRVRRSKMAMHVPLRATTATTASVVGGCNGLPQNRVDCVADALNRNHRADRDEDDQHRVFDEVLSVFGSDQAVDGNHDALHKTAPCGCSVPSAADV